jgi:hypothetical protein
MNLPQFVMQRLTMNRRGRRAAGRGATGNLAGSLATRRCGVGALPHTGAGHAGFIVPGAPAHRPLRPCMLGR